MYVLRVLHNMYCMSVTDIATASIRRRLMMCNYHHSYIHVRHVAIRSISVPVRHNNTSVIV